MEYKVVEILSSREFYKMVDILNEILLPDELCVLDFTNISRIDAVVIPNLLLLGNFIEKKTKNIPYIRLGTDLKSGYLKKYLLDIKFYELSASCYFYENSEEKYGGLNGKDMEEKNTTERFLLEDGIDMARRRLYYNIYPFIKIYLKAFNTVRTNSDEVLNYETFKNNLVANFLEEMIDNAFHHGKSDVIITVQKIFKKKKIYLSVSDAGEGFFKSIFKCMDQYGNFFPKDEDADPGYNILGRCPKNELEAILVGIYKRKYSNTYGLFNVIRKILRLGGLIRVHSNDTQFILTKSLEERFLQGTLSKNMKILTRYNIINTSYFNGVHIEVELPLDIIGGRILNNVYN